MVPSTGDAFAKSKRSSEKSRSIVEKKADTPLVIVVSLGKQQLTVFEGENQIRRSPISSGQSGYRTPMGIFSIIQKNREHYSNLYNDAPMPFMQRITWSGIAMHQGRLPGYPASHGCIRLPWDTAKNLFSMTTKGTRVIVTDDPVSPVDYAHPRLFKPLPPLETLAPAAAADTASSSAPVATGSQTSAGSMSMSSIIGVSAAHASEGRATAAAQDAAPAGAENPGSSVFPTRAQLMAARAAAMAKLKQEIELSKERVRAAQELIDEMRLSQRRAVQAVKDHRAELSQREDDLREAKRDARNYTADMDKFERHTRRMFERAERTGKPLDDKQLGEAAAEEDRIEYGYSGAVERVALAERQIAALKADEAAKRAAVDKAIEHVNAAMLASKKHRKQLFAAHDEVRQAERAERDYAMPIAIFISRKHGRIFVRQGFKDLLEAPVTIADPEKPLGTHVFTALEFNRDKTDLSWTLVSVEGTGKTVREKRYRTTSRGRRKSYYVEVEHDGLPAGRKAAGAALSRIEIPLATQHRIAELVKPGSSLIISDRGKSIETGKGTDFIVSLN